MKICAVIPTHNHAQALPGIVAALKTHGIPVFIIDDGSAEPYRTAIAALEDVILKHLPVNAGKGVAVMEGFRIAHASGFTHVLQIDADGQHDVNAIPAMITAATQNPDALISGLPIYDASMPLGRKIGRWVTHIWVWIETWSLHIRDSMCGFRIYPLKSTIPLITDTAIGHHMDFDTDIMVRLFWRGVDVVAVPVKVIYPPENTSNFDVLRDNIRISLMHTRLVIERILGLHKKREITHWANNKERGFYLGLRFCVASYRLLGRKVCEIILAPIVAYFFLTGGRQRRAISRFLVHALGRKPTLRETFRPFWNFAMRMLDNFSAWQGHITADRIRARGVLPLADMFKNPRGGLIVSSHLGNADMARITMDPSIRKKLIILVHSHNAIHYNRAVGAVTPDNTLNMIQVTEFGPETILDLQQRLDQGSWIVIAGDRLPVSSEGRVVQVPFFGEQASFAIGPWLLAALLDCPVRLLFCLPKDSYYELAIAPFVDRVILPRNRRDEALQEYAAQYAAQLQMQAAAAPYQWFNFFDFWAKT